MKKVLHILFALTFIVPLTYAQNIEVEQLKKSSEIAKEQIQEVLQNGLLLEEFLVCEEIYEWDTVANQFDKAGEGSIEYEIMGALKRLTIITETWDEGEVNDFKVESYLSFQDPANFVGQVFGDSVLLYLGDGEGNYELFTKTIYYYENEQVVTGETYTDFSIFGLPIGFALSNKTHYTYDNDDFLIWEVNESINWDTYELEFSDSTTYDNNNIGYPLVVIGYQADFFTQEIKPYFKEEFSYVNQMYVDVELSYLPAGDDAWLLNNRHTITYDNQNRQTETLTEVTYDNGGSWVEQYRNSSTYEEDLPLMLPTSDLDQIFIDGAWRNETLNTYEECTSGSEIIDVDLFEAWFDKDQLNLRNTVDGEGQVQIFDMSGKVYYQNRFDILPERIMIPGLSRGVYLLQVQQKDRTGILKIFK